MYCSHCGKPIDKDDLFCRYCGTKVKKIDEEEQTEDPEENKKEIDLLVDFETVDTLEDTLNDNDILASLDVPNNETDEEETNQIEESEESFGNFIETTDGELNTETDYFVNELPILDEDIESFKVLLESYSPSDLEIENKEDIDNYDLGITEEDIATFRKYLEQAELDNQLEEAVNELKDMELDTNYDPDMYALPIADEDINSMIDFVEKEKPNIDLSELGIEETKDLSEIKEEIQIPNEESTEAIVYPISDEDIKAFADILNECGNEDEAIKFRCEHPDLFNEDGSIKTELLDLDLTTELIKLRDELQAKINESNNKEKEEIKVEEPKEENTVEETNNLVEGNLETTKSFDDLPLTSTINTVNEEELGDTSTLNDLPGTKLLDVVNEETLGETKSLEELPLTNTLPKIEEDSLGNTELLSDLPLTGAINVIPEEKVEEKEEVLDTTTDLATKVDPSIFEHSEETAVVDVIPNKGINTPLQEEQITQVVLPVNNETTEMQEDDNEEIEKPKTNKLIIAIIIVALLIVIFVVVSSILSKPGDKPVVDDKFKEETYKGLVFKKSNILNVSDINEEENTKTFTNNNCKLTIKVINPEDANSEKENKIIVLRESGIETNETKINNVTWYKYNEENRVNLFTAYSNGLYLIEFEKINEDNDCNEALDEITKTLNFK